MCIMSLKQLCIVLLLSATVLEGAPGRVDASRSDLDISGVVQDSIFGYLCDENPGLCKELLLKANLQKETASRSDLDISGVVQDSIFGYLCDENPGLCNEQLLKTNLQKEIARSMLMFKSPDVEDNVYGYLCKEYPDLCKEKLSEIETALQKQIVTQLANVVQIGFEKPKVTVKEDDGSVTVCAGILNPQDVVDIPFTFLLIETIDGTADEKSDYVPVEPDDLKYSRMIYPGNTKACFPIQIINDDVPELDETFKVRLVLDQPQTDNVVLAKDAQTVEITIFDDEIIFKGVKALTARKQGQRYPPIAG